MIWLLAYLGIAAVFAGRDFRSRSLKDLLSFAECLLLGLLWPLWVLIFLVLLIVGNRSMG